MKKAILLLFLFSLACAHGEFEENSTAFLYGLNSEQQRINDRNAYIEAHRQPEPRRSVTRCTSERQGYQIVINCEER